MVPLNLVDAFQHGDSAMCSRVPLAPPFGRTWHLGWLQQAQIAAGFKKDCTGFQYTRLYMALSLLLAQMV